MNRSSISEQTCGPNVGQGVSSGPGTTSVPNGYTAYNPARGSSPAAGFRGDR